MSYLQVRSDDVIVRTIPAPRYRSRDSNTSAPTHDALIYSNLPIPDLNQQTGHYPPELRNLPLCGVEQLRIGERVLGPWLASFIEGEKGLELMRHKMLELMSPGLRNLLGSFPEQMRIWWDNLSPELEELPWELAVEAGRRNSEHGVAFLRGLPPETPIPPLPLRGAARLGMIGPRWTWPEWAGFLADHMADSVVTIEGPIRQALQDAASRGIEFLHVFTDGVVSSALEGILYDHTEEEGRELLPAAEISRILSGSRVVVMALSPAQIPEPETVEIGRRPVLSAYRAFRHLGTSTRSLPTILAPLGPVPEEMMTRFWKAFYEELATQWHLTDSLRKAQSMFQFSVPIAVFSRHAGGKLFQSSGSQSGDEHPMQSRVGLIQSEQLTAQLNDILAKYQVEAPESVRELFRKEAGLQSKLRGELKGLIDREGLS